MDVRTQIEAELERIEQEAKAACVIYACESGSRAWGFESTDSDYDVRFIYTHPTEWYLHIMSGSDTIERPIEGLLDVSGWDLKKALQLLRKSNPPLLEWLQSPIVYHGAAAWSSVSVSSCRYTMNPPHATITISTWHREALVTFCKETKSG